MHFRFEAIRKNPTNGKFVMEEQGDLPEIGEAKDDMLEEDGPSLTPSRPSKKNVQFHTPAPGMSKNFYTTKNLENELLDFDKINEKYSNSNAKEIPSFMFKRNSSKPTI